MSILALLALTLPAQRPHLPARGWPDLDERSRQFLIGDRGSHGDRSGSGCWPSAAPATPLQAVEAYWYWNAQRFVPAPAPLHFDPADLVGDGSGGTSADPADPLVVRAALRRAAGDADPERRAGALGALGALGPNHGTLDLLLAGLTDPVPAVQQAAAMALGQHGGTQARFALVRQLDAADTDLAAAAALALGVAGQLDGVCPSRELLRLTQEADPRRREAAWCALLLADPAAAAPSARDWLDSRRVSFPTALAIQTATADLLPDRGAKLLQKWLHDADFTVASSALAVLARRGSVDATLLPKLTRSNPGETVRSLLLAGSAASYPENLEVSATSRLGHAMALAIHARDHAADRPWLAVAAIERDHHMAEEKPAFLLAAALAGDPSAPARIRQVLNDPRGGEDQRYFACLGAAVLGGEAVELLPPLLDPAQPARVQAAAAFAIARRGQPADLTALRRAAASSGDPQRTARLAGALGHTRSPTALAALLRLTMAEHEVVRHAAWAGIRRCLQQDDRQPLRELATRGGHEWLPPWVLTLVAG